MTRIGTCARPRHRRATVVVHEASLRKRSSLHRLHRIHLRKIVDGTTPRHSYPHTPGVVPCAPPRSTNGRRVAECAKCNPIDINAQKQNTRPLPTPVTRQEAAPDEELLAVESPDGSGHQQPPPLGPTPKLEEKKRARNRGEAALTLEVVVPEWKVLNTATQTAKRSGEEAARHARTFSLYFAEVHARSGTRLRVGRSPVQVCLVWRDISVDTIVDWWESVEVDRI